MTQSEEKLKEIVHSAELKSQEIIKKYFSGKVTANNYVELQEVAVEMAFFSCYMGQKHFKFDKQRLINYITKGINLRFQVLEEEQGETNEQH